MQGTYTREQVRALLQDGFEPHAYPTSDSIIDPEVATIRKGFQPRLGSIDDEGKMLQDW
ncbi:MAG: hypothetical protein ABFS39_15735 [Pseudomonadota bacterium]